MQEQVISLSEIKNKKENVNMSKNKSKVVIEGLSEMVAQADRVEAKSSYDLRAIPLNEISLHPKNMFGMRDIEKIAKSMQEVGQLHNAVVRIFKDPNNENIKYQLISGERRYRGAEMNNWETLYCKVVDVDDLEAEKLLIVTNIETRELNDMEKSNSVTRLYEIVEAQRSEGVDFNGKKTREVVSDLMSTEGKKVSPAVVGQLKKLSDLIDEFKPLVESGEISRELGYQYAQMPPEAQKMVYEAFQSGKELTAKEAKDLKEQLMEKDTNHAEIISKMKEDIKKKEEEVLDFKKQADQAEIKAKRLEAEKKQLEKNLSDSKESLSKAQSEKENALKDNEQKAKELRAKLEKAIKEEASKENEKLIKDLKDQIEQATKVSDEISKSYDSEIEKLKSQLEEKEKQLKTKSIEKTNVEGNKSIQSLARQTQKAFEVLFEEITKMTKLEGFELNEETKQIIAEITKYEIIKNQK